MKHVFKNLLAVLVALSVFFIQPAMIISNASWTETETASEAPDFSGLGAVGSLSEERTQEIASAIYEGLKNHEEDIFLNVLWNELDDDMMMDSLGNIYRAVIRGWDVGILTSADSTQLYGARHGEEIYVSLAPNYLVEDSEYDATYDRMMQEIDSIISGVDNNWSDEEKALYLHDYIAVHYNYDNDRIDEDISHQAYGMLESGYGVCEAYAHLYNVLLHRVGIESAMVRCTSMLHAWNLVQLNGNWYHVDITWDDNFQGHAGLLRHDNFLKTSEEMLNTNHSYAYENEWVLTCGQVVNELPTSDFYKDAFWNNCDSQILNYQGQWFAIHCDSESYNATVWFDLCDYNPSTATAEITSLISLNITWFDFESSNHYWGGSYISNAIVNDKIYYSTPTDVYCLNGTNVEWLFDLNSEQRTEGYIYGMFSEGNTLHYYLSYTPYSETKEYTYQVEENSYTTEPETQETEPETQETEPETTKFYGDLDGDSEIASDDIIIIQKYLMKQLTFTEEQYMMADITQDGVINIYDMIALKRMLMDNPQ